MQPEQQGTAWDGYPPDPERPGYHWLRRTDAHGPMPAVIWTWRPEVQAWRWKGEAEIGPAEQAATKEYIAPVTDHADVERLRAALRPFAGCVYNDNGDMLVSAGRVTSDDFCAAYFAINRESKR